MRLLRDDLHTLTGIYALDALDSAAERDRFARHLNRCQSCSSEVRGLREVATALAFAAAIEPPPELRAQVLTAAARTRQLPPEVNNHAPPRRGARVWGWMPWLAGSLATASIVLAVVFGFMQANTSQQLGRVQAQNQEIAAVLSAPGARLLAATTTKGGVATVVLAAARRELVVTMSGLPALPAGKVYQLWLIGPTKIVSAGLVPAPASSGVTPAVLASGIVTGDKLGLTVEPAPGSAQPTTTPILALPLPL
ncbi:MAG: anti-sigma factor [Streptosporangiaceae bacterium]